VLGDLDANDMIEQARLPAVLLVFGAALTIPCLAPANELNYGCSVPPLEVRFAPAAGCAGLLFFSGVYREAASPYVPA
jgi:hypothetical protein